MANAIYPHVTRREIFPRHRTRTRKDGTPICKHLRKKAVKDPNWQKWADKLRDQSGSELHR